MELFAKTLQQKTEREIGGSRFQHVEVFVAFRLSLLAGGVFLLLAGVIFCHRSLSAESSAARGSRYGVKHCN